MKHLILCREYPPAPYPPGGIGTYVAHIARALAERGETVHVIGQRWRGADRQVDRQCGGRLHVHRISAEDTALYPTLSHGPQLARAEVAGMMASDFPAQWFSWVAAGLAERLIERERIDIIEGQEWEAPLYYLLLRRALGLGPKRKPPCIVHLHSPTEFIFRHNEWSLGRPNYLPMKRLEDYVIKAADAHLCPSRFLADKCEPHYGLEPGSIAVIPLPLGDTPPIARDPEVWANGSICYFGRLEPRKGVIEWVDAAVAVALQRPTPIFEFIGSDLRYTERTTVRQYVKSRIPPAISDRFVFHDSRPRAEMLRMLGKARMAVVPSRWENFPNTCLEAMCTGLPVLATRNGGMAEMIQDGVTGWLAPAGPGPLADRLAETLQRGLATPPARLAAMGSAAAASIRRICDNNAIADRHIAFRAGVVRREAQRSRKLPSCYPWPERPVRPRPARAAVSGPASKNGIAVAVLALRGRSFTRCIASLAAQSGPPAHIMVVSDVAPPQTAQPDYRFIPYPGTSTAAAKQLAMEALGDADPVGWMFLDAEEALEPWALRSYEQVLRHCPEVGMAAGWNRDAATGTPEPTQAPPPAFPYQWLANGLGGPTMYRTQALRDAGGLRTNLEHGQEEWDLATAVMAAGWAAVRVPALLATRVTGEPAGEAVPVAYRRTRRILIQRFPELLGDDAPSLVTLLEARGQYAKTSALGVDGGASPLAGAGGAPLGKYLGLALAAVRDPRRAARWLLSRGKNIVRGRVAVARNTPVEWKA